MMPDTARAMDARLPLTWVESRARFLHAASRANATLDTHPIDHVGPHGERLSVDVAHVGSPGAARTLVVMSGVHGIEGYAGSAIQTDDLLGLDAAALPPGCSVLYVHAVNPWGMAWWRRQNESNVDLNRNAVDFGAPRPGNPGYLELHPWLCPDVVDDTSTKAFVEAAGRFIEARGYAWVKEAVTAGQYEVEDGLYYGGSRREASTRILIALADIWLKQCASLLFVDLHTGHGPHGACTLLSGAASDSEEAAFLRRAFEGETIESPIDDPKATTPHKRGQLTLALCEPLPAELATSVTLEIGTVDDMTMILAERAEHAVWRAGRLDSPEAEAVRWNHRVASIPDDPAWTAQALEHGRRVLARARAALFEADR